MAYAKLNPHDHSPIYRRLFAWVVKNPGDTLALLSVAATAGLSLLSLFGESIDVKLVIFGIAVSIGTLAALSFSDRQSRSRTDDSIRRIATQLSLSESDSLVTEIPAARIAQELSKLLKNADSWSFRGGSGRWQREEVLPTLSRITDRTVKYRMQVINPLNERLVEQYAEYRSKLRASLPAPDRGAAVTPEKLVDELLACILAVGWYSQHHRIKPSLTLLDTYSPLRIDASQDGVMITVADRSKSGIFAGASGWYHTSVHDEFDQYESLGKAVRFPKKSKLPHTLTAESVGDFFSEMAILNWTEGVFNTFDERRWKAISTLSGVK